jgi:hypothetical protein
MAKLGPEHAETLGARGHLANAYLVAGRTDEALTLHNEVLRLREAKLGPDHPDTLTSRLDLGNAYIPAGRIADAEPLLREFINRGRGRFSPDDLRLANAMAMLGLRWVQQEKWAEAETILRECLAIREAKDPDVWNTFNTRSLLGGALLGQGRHSEAEPLIVSGYEGIKAREATIPPTVRVVRVGEAAGRVVRLYEDWGKPEEAARWRAKLAADLPDPDIGFPVDPFVSR